MHYTPYVLNIAILLPVVASMLRTQHGAPVAAFGGIADAPALRMMVACLWAGVLLMSLIALSDPTRYWPLLAFQVAYKVMFLALYCLPIWLGRETGVIPSGAVAVFIFIIAIWPFFIVMALQSGQT